MRDELSAAGADAATLASCVILSQDVHTLFGGVVPEIASRQHLTGIVPAVEEALRAANVTLDDVDAIAVTTGPGLIGGVIVGMMFAKALAAAADKPWFQYLVDLLPQNPIDSAARAFSVSTWSAFCNSPVARTR